MKIKSDWARAYVSNHAIVRKIARDWEATLNQIRPNLDSRYYSDQGLRTLFTNYLNEFNKNNNVVAEYDWTSDFLIVSLDEHNYTLLELKYS